MKKCDKINTSKTSGKTFQITCAKIVASFEFQRKACGMLYVLCAQKGKKNTEQKYILFNAFNLPF